MFGYSLSLARQPAAYTEEGVLFDVIRILGGRVHCRICCRCCSAVVAGFGSG